MRLASSSELTIPATGPDWTVRIGARLASSPVIAPPAHCAKRTWPAKPFAAAPDSMLSMYWTIRGPIYAFITAVVVRSYSPNLRDQIRSHTRQTHQGLFRRWISRIRRSCEGFFTDQMRLTANDCAPSSSTSRRTATLTASSSRSDDDVAVDVDPLGHFRDQMLRHQRIWLVSRRDVKRFVRRESCGPASPTHQEHDVALASGCDQASSGAISRKLWHSCRLSFHERADHSFPAVPQSIRRSFLQHVSIESKKPTDRSFGVVGALAPNDQNRQG